VIDADATIALTGVGAVTPLGDAGRTWDGLLAGDSGLVAAPAAIQRAGCGVVGPASWFDAGALMDRNTARRMGRFSQFSVVAATMAMAEAGLDGYAGDGLGVVLHTGAGGLLEAEATAGVAAARPTRVSPLFVPVYGPNMAACQPSIVLGATGPVHGGVGACAAGVQAVIEGMRVLQRGEAEVVVAGGTDSTLSPMLLGSLANAGALAPAGGDPRRRRAGPTTSAGGGWWRPRGRPSSSSRRCAGPGSGAPGCGPWWPAVAARATPTMSPRRIPRDGARCRP
jgi:3-oxoacyl-[acyl-carrier-protein] synthase II